MSILTYSERDGKIGLLDEWGRFIEPLMGAKGDVNVPPPSPEETALKQKQLSLINYQESLAKQQAAEQEALAPYLYQQMGLKKVSTLDEAKIASLESELAKLQSSAQAGGGTIKGLLSNLAPQVQGNQQRIAAIQAELKKLRSSPTVSFQKMTPEELRAAMSPDEQQAADIRDLANQRTLKALQGNLDVDPSVEADIQRGEAQLRQELLRKLGPGAEGSESWNRAMSEYNRNMNALRYSVRHGEMTSADALAANRVNEFMKRQEQSLRNIKGATEPYGAASATMSGINAGIGGAIGQYYGERVNAADLALQGSNIRNAFWGNTIGAGLSAAGTLGGAAVLACWIAEALYGHDAEETHLLRYWLNHVWAPRSVIGRMTMALYGRYGQRVAGWVRRYPLVRWALKPIFDRALRVAQRELTQGGSYGQAIS